MEKTNVIKTFAAAILFVTAFAVNAQQTTSGNSEISFYQSSSVISPDCSNIKFSLRDYSYIKMYAVNNFTGEKILLVDGDISSGNHGIMLKINTAINSFSSYTCIMEIFDINSGKLMNTSSITLQ